MTNIDIAASVSRIARNIHIWSSTFCFKIHPNRRNAWKKRKVPTTSTIAFSNTFLPENKKMKYVIAQSNVYLSIIASTIA